MKRAFTLIELLVVIAIVALLAFLAIPPFSVLVDSNNLAMGGQMVVGEIGLARQIASARNVTAEVRLIQMKNADKGYRGIQIWAADATGTMQPVDRMTILPETTLIVRSQLSRMLASLPAGTLGTGGVAPGAPYLSFRIRPSGIVEPVPEAASRSDLYLTLVPARFADEEVAKGSPNYFTVQINPDTAIPRSYRP